MDRLAQLWERLAPPLLPAGLPDFVPNLLLTVLIAVVAGALAAPRLGLRHRALGAMWLLCLLAPLAYTLSATRNGGAAGCQLGLAPWESQTALLSAETRNNIALLAPAGAAAFLMPAGARRLAALGAALAMPLLIETTQMIVRPLGRACQVSDIVNNTVGVILGFVLAAGVWAVWDSIRRLTTGTAQQSLTNDTGLPAVFEESGHASSTGSEPPR